MFCFTQNVLNKQFPERTPQIISFIFFHYICPVLVNPVKYDIMEEAPTHALTGLVNTSKLLKDVALNCVEKWQNDPLVLSYIEKNHPAIMKHMNLILVRTSYYNINFWKDEADLASCKAILEASTPSKPPRDTEAIEMDKMSFAIYLQKFSHPDGSFDSSGVARDSAEMVIFSICDL
jgi:hypothetical protein